MCIVIIHGRRKNEKRQAGERKEDEERKKRKVKKQNKKMRKRIEANIQSFSTNCDQMSFFWQKEEGKREEKKNKISIGFETNIIKENSGVTTVEFTVKMNKFTQTGTTNLLSLSHIQY